ncbi:hypothetical protein [Marinimicrobium sp. ABcell2]|uniref:hypothetical protein n=1 Tax=Marinimicrobium sp. ABcell2 TaxID=3069751 RepID=UPI0027B09EC8|nr:hypothetical protein [Marinimicrobium sp. ABcell2]MDQ2077563.1 hypothetical protein [Marinimicrobium sp. ABcell2]
MTDVDPSTYWPEPVATTDRDPVIVTSDLTDGEKALLWRHLVSHHPELARTIALLSKDDTVSELVSLLDAGFQFEAKAAPPSLQNKAR